MSAMTVVYRRAARGRFQPTGFRGDWAASHAEADRLDAELRAAGATDPEVYYVAADDVDVLVGSGRRVTIAPTQAERDAATARGRKVDQLLARQDAAEHWRPLIGAARRVGAIVSTDRAAAEALVDAGWDWSTVCRALS